MRNGWERCQIFTYFVNFYLPLYMQVTDVATGKKKPVIIRETEAEDFKILTRKCFSFEWKTFKNSMAIYTLRIEGEDGILGVMGLVDWQEEQRIEIKLLSTSIENIGKLKIYEGIAGCLIAFACRLAVSKYGPEACVSLVPKTALIRHYMEKYNMQHAGWQLYLVGINLFKIVKEYT